MKLKKHLQQKAEKDAESLLTEDDLQFCMQLAADVQEKPVVAVSKKPKIKLWASLGSAIAVALVAVIVLPVALSQKPDNEIYYKEENINHITCQLQDLNSDSNYFEIVILEDTDFRFELYYDTVSNDSLYYEIRVTTLISDFNIFIVVNKNYDYKFDLGEGFLTEQLDEYTINYKSYVLDGIGEAAYDGVIKSDTETVYIKYTQIFDIGVQAFFEDIQSVLKVKS